MIFASSLIYYCLRMYNWKIGIPIIYSTPGTNDKNRTPPQKKKERIFLYRISHPSQKIRVILQVIRLLWKIKKLIPRMYRSVFLRFRNLFQNMLVLLLLRIIWQVGIKKKNQVAQVWYVLLVKHHLLIWMIWTGKLIPRKWYLTENKILSRHSHDWKYT